MAGIARINITNPVTGPGALRFEQSRMMQAPANALYRAAFAQIGMPLEAGDKIIDTDKEEFHGGYDKDLGIDVHLLFDGGHRQTMQEKFLSYQFRTFRTVTVEYKQDWVTGEQGDWYNMQCDYYFCGYINADNTGFGEWAILDWPATIRATIANKIPWQSNVNQRDGARASFKFAKFWEFPSGCVIASNVDAESVSYMSLFG